MKSKIKMIIQFFITTTYNSTLVLIHKSLIEMTLQKIKIKIKGKTLKGSKKNNFKIKQMLTLEIM